MNSAEVLLGRRFTDARGCELKATFYVSSWYTDFDTLHNLWADGHEIAVHTITHATAYESDYTRWYNELEGSKLLMSKLARIPEHHIKGSRAPFLAYSKQYFQALHDLGFEYESTLREYGIQSPWASLISDGPGNKIWPYTFDFGSGQNCEIGTPGLGKCSSQYWSFPGLWEVPLWSMDRLPGGTVSALMDEGNWDVIRENFLATYNGNRRPFGLFYHATRNTMGGVAQLLEMVKDWPDVFFVTNAQLVEWMKNPVDVAGVHASMRCDKPVDTQPCPPSDVSTCALDTNYFRMCGECPAAFPGGATPLENTKELLCPLGPDMCLQGNCICGGEAADSDCVVTEWGSWGGCSQDCGGGTRTRSRGIITPQAGSGAACPALTQTQACNSQACSVVPVDCQVSAWGLWSQCSAVCEGGTRYRTRTVTVQQANGGAVCGDLVEEEACNPDDCEPGSGDGLCVGCIGGTSGECRGLNGVCYALHATALVCPGDTSLCDTSGGQECELTGWSAWGRCSSQCGGGEQIRTRHVVQPAQGGSACPAAVETRACNTHACPVGQPCEVSEWSDWSACATGSAEQTRTRSITVPPGGNAPPCPALLEARDTLCPVDCVLAEWSTWSPCVEGQAAQTRTRAVQVEPVNDGVPCMGTVQTRTSQCPVNCIMAEWGAWGDCTVLCDGGTRTRERTVAVPPVNGGACGEPVLESEPCNTQACPGVSCGVSQWSDWSPCNVGSALQTRTRAVVVAPEPTGLPCPELSQTRTSLCPVDCALSDWSDWSPCGATSPDQTRTRSVVTAPVNGGATCGALIETRDTLCVVDCALSAWTAWSQCSVECGGGSTTRSRGVAVPAANGGAECSGAVEETTSCNDTPCVEVVDCEVSPWSAWSDCLVTSPVQTRSRSVLTQPANGGNPCPALAQSRSDVCSVDCVLSEWGAWSACTNGVATRTRSRSVVTVPANGGATCALTIETQPCAVQCVVSEWGQWSAWTVCVASLRTRSRSRIVTTPGQPCPSLEESQSEPCSGSADVDCVVGAWSSWTQCSAACGGGAQVASRPVVQGQRGDGAPCGPLTRGRECNAQACAGGGGGGACDGCWPGTAGPCQHPANTVCYSYFPGSSVCPGGTVTCSGTGGGGGTATDCVAWAWSAWGTCSAACDGSQVRTRDVVTPASNGGTLCTPLEESRSCGTDCGGDDDDDSPPPPPVDCVLSPWSDWQACSVTCGGGTRRSDRTIVTAPSNGGAECGVLTRTETCNTQACQGGGDQCTSCWPGTSGPCRAANTVCYEYMDAATATCPPGTAACAAVGSASVPAAVTLTIVVQGVRADYMASTYGRFALAAAVATSVGGGLTPDQVVLQGVVDVEPDTAGTSACRVSFAIVTPAASRVSAGEAAVVLALDATLHSLRDNLAGRWVGSLALASVGAPLVVPGSNDVAEVAIGSGAHALEGSGVQAGGSSPDGAALSPAVTAAAAVTGVVVLGVAFAVWKTRRSVREPGTSASGLVRVASGPPAWDSAQGLPHSRVATLRGRATPGMAWTSR